MMLLPTIFVLFFFNDTATTEIYTLSLHDALPISFEQSDDSSGRQGIEESDDPCIWPVVVSDLRSWRDVSGRKDRKSTRLNSSHQIISYAVFCLKKKKPQPC